MKDKDLCSLLRRFQGPVGEMEVMHEAADRIEALTRPETPLKDHQIAQTVNAVRDVAIKFHDHQSLRERIAEVLVPALQQPAPADQEAIRNATRAKTLLVYLWRMYDASGISMGRSRESVLLESAQALLGDADMVDLSQDEGKNVGEARDWISKIRRKQLDARHDHFADIDAAIALQAGEQS